MIDGAITYRRERLPFDHNRSMPAGQAAHWHADVLNDPHVPMSGLLVARQVARLCGDDSLVVLPWRSLADAVGRADRDGRHIAYTQRGVQCLTDAEWLRVETVGRGRAAKTTFFLLPADVNDGYIVNINGGELAA